MFQQKNTKTTKSSKPKKRSIYYRLVDAEQIKLSESGKAVQVRVNLVKPDGSRRTWNLYFPEKRISIKPDGVFVPQWMLELKNKELVENAMKFFKIDSEDKLREQNRFEEIEVVRAK